MSLEHMLQSIGEDIWCRSVPFVLMGVPIGGRMTVVKLSDGGLLIYSPTRLEEGLVEAVRQIGEVRFIIAPNLFHHLYAGKWRDAFPEAKLYAPLGFEKKRKDLTVDGVLGEDPGPWASDLEHVVMGGMPSVNETLFFHPKSKSLMLTDLAFHLPHGLPGLWPSIFFVLDGLKKGLSSSLLIRLVTRNRAAARATRDRVLAWPVERLLPCHGEILEEGAREALEKALAWMG